MQPGGRVNEPLVAAPHRQPGVWIVEDEPAAAALAAELCSSAGLDPTVFAAPLPFLAALRDEAGPRAVVLDWRLERELSAALFMATRHRHPRVPVIYWTGSLSSALPAMILDDEMTIVVEKSGGAVPFERAIAWAIGPGPGSGGD
jgi:FixJ family two-component response regulator